MTALIRRLKDPYCAISHFAGSILSVVAMIVLLCVTTATPWHYVSFTIYGLSLIMLFTASGLTHSVSDPAREDRFERWDYISIFALIAGTYTPLCLTILRGPWGWSLLIIEWLLALLGSILVLSTDLRPKKITTPLYLIMGWLIIFAIVPMLKLLPMAGFWWLAAGGVAYSVGAVIFTLDRPTLWPGKFSAHDLWHTLVLCGSGCHFVVMLCFLA